MSYLNVATQLLRGRRAETALAVLTVAGLGAMYWHLGAVFAGRWLESPAYYHCPAVPLVAAWFVWRRWDALARVEPRPAALGFALLGLGLGLYWAAARTGVRVIDGLTIPIVLAGIVGAVYGREALGLTTGPIALLVFAIPFPEHAIGMVAMPMQQVSAVITGAVAPLLGLEVVRQGINLDLSGFTFVVAQECSGMHSLVALLLTGFVLVELSGLGALRRLAAIALILPIVLLANVVRLVAVLLTGQYLGPEFALGMMVHGFSDIIVYFAALLSLVLAIGWLYEGEQRRAEATAAEMAAADPGQEGGGGSRAGS